MKTKNIYAGEQGFGKRSGKILTFLFTLISLVYIYPVFVVLFNSLKSGDSITLSPFTFPNSETFVGFENYINGINHGNYPFYKSVAFSFIITVLSTFLILLCTSMAAWYNSRVDTPLCRVFYYLCIFSMVVPFQMVMFTLSKTADRLMLNTPFTIPVIYLGFGAGLAVFMFTGFVKSIPIEIEEAATIDGCGPVSTFFRVVVPIMRPTYISVGIPEIMWIWNDYLLPYLVLNQNEYKTIPIHIQYLQGSFGRRDMGAIMALIILCLIPIAVFYFMSQKYIIKGVVAGAVKG